MHPPSLITASGRASGGQQALRSVLPTVAASALEGYDLTIYGLLAGTIAKAFFPTSNATTSLLLAVATLGVGYVVRPLGGVLLGAYGDRVGRKAAIFLTVVLMALSTGIMGLIPSYATIGVAAPLLIVLARLVQGFAAGGGASSSISFLSEVAPPGRRGFYASWHQTIQVGSFLLASALAALISNVVPADTFGTLGWRIPFVLALAFGPVGWLIRSRLREPDMFVRDHAHQTSRPPMARSVGARIGGICIGFGVSCLWTITGFLLLIFMPTYANKAFGIPLSGAYTSAMVGGALLFVLCPMMGSLSDRIGRRSTMLASAVVFACAAYPLFAYVGSTRTVASLMLVQAAFSVLIAGYTGPIGAFMAELFPTHIRSTGVSIANNIAVTVVGSFSPLITTWLIHKTGNPLAPAWYLMGGAAVSALAVACARDRTTVALDNDAIEHETRI